MPAEGGISRNGITLGESLYGLVINAAYAVTASRRFAASEGLLAR